MSGRLLLLPLLLGSLSPAIADTREDLRFITCPIYRDTNAGRKSGCWLADDPATATRYDVTSAPSKPDWNYGILVEGKPSAATGSPCGGVVLDPVRVSVLQTPCTRRMLPAEGHAGKKFVLPKRNIAPMSVKRTPPSGPFGARTFDIFFEWDRSFLMYQYDDYLLDQAVTWLRAANAAHITVTGFSDRSGDVVSGQVMRESPEIADERAKRIALALTRLGFDPTKITVTTAEGKSVDSDDADHLLTPSRRRVEISATF